jgi:hypothetical protein
MVELIRVALLLTLVLVMEVAWLLEQVYQLKTQNSYNSILQAFMERVALSLKVAVVKVEFYETLKEKDSWKGMHQQPKILPLVTLYLVQ